jgi:hypothetical protein
VSDAKDIPENLRELYEYIRTGKVGGNLTRRIDEAVARARKNEVWRSEYVKELLHDDDVRAEGRAEGEAHGEVKGTIRTCKDFGLTFEETVNRIREMFQLPENEAQRDMKLYW